MQWHLTPTEFWECSTQDKAYMIAYCQDESRMRAWEDAEAERQHRIDSARRGSK